MDSFWSGIIGAVVGAIAGSVVSGLISWRMQSSAASSAQEQRNEDRENQQKALGHAIQFKIIRIASNLKLLNGPVQEAFAYREAHPTNPWVWTFLRSQANEFARVDFTADELASLIGAKEMDLFNKVCDLDAIHNDTLALMRTFSTLRAALDRKVPRRKTPTGYEIVLNPEQYQAVELDVASVESIVQHLVERFPVDVAQADEAFRLVNDMMKRRFGSNLHFADRAPTRFRNS